jgi:hypothetical protein
VTDYLRTNRFFDDPEQIQRVHPRDCARQHTAFAMGVYDGHGMRLNSFNSMICHDDPAGIDLDEAAKANAAYWPGNQVHLWFDTSLTPTEHLRDMPPSDGSWPKVVGR